MSHPWAVPHRKTRRLLYTQYYYDFFRNIFTFIKQNQFMMAANDNFRMEIQTKKIDAKLK